MSVLMLNTTKSYWCFDIANTNSVIRPECGIHKN